MGDVRLRLSTPLACSLREQGDRGTTRAGWDPSNPGSPAESALVAWDLEHAPLFDGAGLTRDRAGLDTGTTVWPHQAGYARGTLDKLLP